MYRRVIPRSSGRRRWWHHWCLRRGIRRQGALCHLITGVVRIVGSGRKLRGCRRLDGLILALKRLPRLLPLGVRRIGRRVILLVVLGLTRVGRCGWGGKRLRVVACLWLRRRRVLSKLLRIVRRLGRRRGLVVMLISGQGRRSMGGTGHGRTLRTQAILGVKSAAIAVPRSISTDLRTVVSICALRRIEVPQVIARPITRSAP